MEYKSAKGYSGWGQLGILFMLIAAGFFFTFIAQFIIGLSIPAPGLSTTEKLKSMMTLIMKPENSFYLQLSQVLATFFLMFLPSLVYMRICHGKNKLWLGFSPRLNLAQVIVAFVIIICANLASEPITLLTKEIISHFPKIKIWAQAKEDEYLTQALAISSMKSTWAAYFEGLLVMAFLPAMFEETLFRGALQNLLVRWWQKPVVAIVFTALIFSYIHGTVYSFFGRAVLGFALGWLYYRSKNIWINIAAHFFNNAIIVTQLFVMARNHEKVDINKMDQSSPLWLGIAAIVVLYALFILFEKISSKNRSAIETDEQKAWIKSTPEYNLADTEID